jgi:preprotein translocase subunit SecE
MATEEDLKNDDAGDAPPHPTEEATERAAELIAPKDGVIAVVHDERGDIAEADDAEFDVAPTQLGYKRYVYAAYFAGAILIAFLASKAIEGAWTRLALWKPAFGEPRGELIIPLSGLLGAGVALYNWRQQKTRQLIEEVASELSKVTWPNKEEVMNSTTVVIFTTLFATVFFALMDRFWGFLTNLVYGT